MKIYHAIDEKQWLESKETGEYTPSTFDKEGFIHASTEEQLLPTVNRKFKETNRVRVVVIDTDKLKPELKFEEASAGEKHPHIYGALNIDASEGILILERKDSGEFKIIEDKSWYGWLIEQSFDDQAVFDEFETVKMKRESEDWKEHIIKIPEDKLEDVLIWISNHLKTAWYAHLVKGDKIIVLYKDKIFRLKSGESFENVADYGRKLGIIEEQLPDEGLFKLARNSGF